MMWYRVFNDDEYQDFNTFAQAESYYDSCMQDRWKAYRDMNMLEDWEEDKQYFDLYLTKVETILSPILA